MSSPSLRSRALIALAAAGLLLAHEAGAQDRLPLSPAAGWATAYLVNAALLEEYAAVLASLPTAGAERDAAMTSDQGVALWQRTAFALGSLEAKSQSVPALAGVKAAHAAHGKILAKRPDFAAVVAVAETLGRAAVSDQAPEVDPAAKSGYAAMAKTFASDAMGQRWQRLTRAYALPSPSCPIELKDVRAFAEHQRVELKDGRAVSAETLLKPIAGWTLPKIQCLVFALMASTPDAKENGGYEPVHLMRALQQGGSPAARDASLKALTAVRLMQLSRYAETLSLVMDLTDLDEAFRLPYEVVQRAYSLRQKGEGAVALQGL